MSEKIHKSTLRGQNFGVERNFCYANVNEKRGIFISMKSNKCVQKSNEFISKKMM